MVTMTSQAGAVARGIPLIAAAILLLFFLGYAVTNFLGLPLSLGFPPWLWAVGGVFALAGLGMIGWSFRARGFSEVVISTYITFRKLATKTPLEAKNGREEPLVVTGPYGYVRSPLYFGVIVLVIGLALLTSYTFILVTAGVVFVWFRVVVIPYEEKELRALFPIQFEQYEKEVPMLVPFTKLGRRSRKTDQSARYGGSRL
jgi:protein-S-isoprenylcysteine O-methyltransferase Ste14